MEIYITGHGRCSRSHHHHEWPDLLRRTEKTKRWTRFRYAAVEDRAIEKARNEGICDQEQRAGRPFGAADDEGCPAGMRYMPHEYQIKAYDWIINKKKSGLFLPMGMGKTSITLTAIEDLMYDMFQVKKVLIIAPIRVAQTTWPDEIEKWDHTRHLTYSRVLGSKEQRMKALEEKADIYLINRENVSWLVEQVDHDWPFDMVVIDELSSFKNPKAKRFKALRKVIPLVDRFIGLTGTPAPKGLPDLWPQVYLMDQGKRLGRTLTSFRSRFLIPGRRNGNVIYEWLLQDGAKRRIYDAIGDICMSLKAEDWLKLPECQYINHEVILDEQTMAAYHRFKREKILQICEDGVITAANAGVVMNKLLQFTAGAVYDENHAVQEIHQVKLNALEDLLEAANGNPLMVFYYFKHDRDRIIDYFPNVEIRAIESQQDVKDWNDGKIEMLLVHPASVGHGLNLQQGGNIIIWYTLPNWNLELYLQANARLHRQGQQNTVMIYHLIAKGTVDEDMIRSLEQKDISQKTLIEALKR